MHHPVQEILPHVFWFDKYSPSYPHYSTNSYKLLDISGD